MTGTRRSHRDRNANPARTRGRSATAARSPTRVREGVSREEDAAVSIGDGETGRDHPARGDGAGATAGIDPEMLAQLQEDLAAALTLWASPGLVDDDAASHLGTVPTLTITPNISAHTRDEYPGADYTDLVLASLLAQGFALLLGFTPAELLELPTPQGWSGQLDAAAAVLTLSGPDGTLYDGDLGAAPPTGWAAQVRDRGRLVVLVASMVDLTGADRTDRTDRIADARRAGQVVGALVPIASTPSR